MFLFYTSQRECSLSFCQFEMNPERDVYLLCKMYVKLLRIRRTEVLLAEAGNNKRYTFSLL